MATNPPPSTDNSGKILLYLIGGIGGLVIGVAALGLLYFALSYLALNMFLGLDLSLFGQLAPDGWLGYALLGLGLGAAGGTIAAQRRFRLHRMLVGGASLLVLALCVIAVVGNTAHMAPPTEEATTYIPSRGQGQCPACTTIEASSTKTDQPANRYTPAKLLDKDPTTAWISDSTTSQTLRLTLNIPPDQRLVGLRIGNGYGKSDAVYTSFSRVRTCRVSLDGGPETSWTLPDSHSEDLFIPLEPAADTTLAVVVFRIDDTYEGENHAEVALSGLTPVIELAKH